MMTVIKVKGSAYVIDLQESEIRIDKNEMVVTYKDPAKSKKIRSIVSTKDLDKLIITVKEKK